MFCCVFVALVLIASTPGRGNPHPIHHNNQKLSTTIYPLTTTTQGDRCDSWLVDLAIERNLSPEIVLSSLSFEHVYIKPAFFMN